MQGCFASRPWRMTSGNWTADGLWRNSPHRWGVKGILERFIYGLSRIEQCFTSDHDLRRLLEPPLMGKVKVLSKRG